MRRFVLAGFAVTVFVACQPATTELTDNQKAEIAAEVRAVAEVSRTTLLELDIEGFLNVYDNSEDFTYALGGNVYRSWSTWADFVRSGLSPIITMESCTFSDAVVQVLAKDVAVYTADAVCSGTVSADGPVMTLFDHTITSVMVKRDGEWKCVNFSETLPPVESEG